MQSLKDMEIGVMFWGGRDPVETLRELKALGVKCGQIGIPGDMPLAGAAQKRKAALDAEHFTVVTAFCAYTGENYADIPTVQKTVGFIPRSTRSERERRTYEVSDFARELGIPSIAAHIGFVPEDSSDSDYVGVRELVRRICDHAAKNHQNFALETGQESAETLRSFFIDVNRPNLAINFDPANMILYGMAGAGGPVDALQMLAPSVRQIHVKDARPSERPGEWGREVVAGTGAVPWRAFFAAAREIRPAVNFVIEREAGPDREADIAVARELVLAGIREPS